MLIVIVTCITQFRTHWTSFELKMKEFVQIFNVFLMWGIFNMDLGMATLFIAFSVSLRQ